ncbi:signal peptidase II [Nocardioides sp. zg-DK7169]|uniref:signal peptidase II n=1 Tax=Nocardioides sp. zg-DK7169 TaxID=2736600 RepID=UPI003463912C
MSAPQGPATTRAGGRRRHIILFAVIALTAYVIDMVTKVVAVDTLQDRDISVVGDLLVLNLVRNPGAAFSVGTEYTVALSCISIGALVAIVWLSRRIGEVWWAVGMGLLLAGVAGNLTDRILRDPGPLRGHVIDFLQIPNWPVFNVADMCVVGAAGLIIVQSFRGLRLNGTRIEP